MKKIGHGFEREQEGVYGSHGEEREGRNSLVIVIENNTRKTKLKN